MTSPAEEIGRVLQTYFDGLYHGDVEKLAEVFHPRAVYATADESPSLVRSMSEYFPVVAGRASPASRNETRKDFVDEVGLAGDNTAMARVRCRIGARDFVDFLSLIREEGRWRIIAKVFQISPIQI